MPSGPAAAAKAAAWGAPAWMRPLASRTRALPEAYCSQQPLLPQAHQWPSGTTVMWPHSPAIPYVPRNTRPSTTRAPPMPVPSVMQTMTPAPRPAPNRYSAQPAAFASLSTMTGRSMRVRRRSRNGSLRQARCGEKRTSACSESTQPAAPIPTEPTRWPARSSWTTSTIASSTLDGLEVGEGRVMRSMTSPVRVTTPAATFVPPMSIPMLSMSR